MAKKGVGEGRKKRQEEPEKPQNHERWLLTYSDMITLIMVFFVVMYALSKVESTKFTALAESLQEAFNMPGIQLEEGLGGHSQTPLDTPLRPPPGTGLSPRPSDKRDPFIERARSTLATEIKTGAVRMNTEARGVVLALAGDINFREGSSTLEPSAMGTMEKIADLIRGMPNPISVEGHSDNTPVAPGSRYDSNLMLSAARAVSVAQALELLDVNKDRLSATGFGDSKPARPNDSPEGRAYNRRVDILIRFDTPG
ncbi:MAG TPA: flagellar motor protein MotB [Rectinemataceae bacterium]|nr:flagellar motor protein MotB [Rectinemataceae bacterium]